MSMQPVSLQETSLEMPALLAARVAVASRQLTNPDVRLPLPADFPSVINVDCGYYLNELLAEQLGKYGETPETVGRLTVAYPHKDPELFPNHYDAARFVADNLVRRLRAATKTRAEIETADGICETVHLRRSENQSVLHAMTGRQVYHFNAVAQKKPLSFMSSNDGPHYFVLADNQVEQGTTLANLASFIHHNGGRVLFAACNRGTGRLVPEAPKHQIFGGPRLAQPFSATTMPDLFKMIGDALQGAAAHEGIKVTRNQALACVESYLNEQGSSLLALTHAEARRLWDGLLSQSVTYSEVAGNSQKKRGLG